MENGKERRNADPEETEHIPKKAKEVMDKITVANFIRYVGPGIVLFGLVRVSKVPFCTTIVTTFKTDKVESTFLLLLFLVVGVIVHTAYRAFFYNKLIIWIKDRRCWQIRDWHNYREVLMIKNTKLHKTADTIFKQIKGSYNADWVWRRLKAHFAHDGYSKYDRGMELWAASIHLLYFSGLSLFIFGILEFCFGEGIHGLRCLVMGIVAFWGGLLADTEYERAETYFYEELDQEEVKSFLQKLFESRAFRTNINQMSQNNGETVAK